MQVTATINLAVYGGPTFNNSRVMTDYNGFNFVLAEAVDGGETDKEIHIGAGSVDNVRGLYIKVDAACSIKLDEVADAYALGANDHIFIAGPFAAAVLDNLGLTNLDSLKITTTEEVPVNIDIAVLTDPTVS